jgi:hypothetical protein
MFVEINDDGPTRNIKAGATEPNQFKDRIRNVMERMLRLDVACQLDDGILLVDGALTLRTYNTPQVFLERLGREASNRNSDLVGISKKSRVTLGGVHMSTLLDEDPSDAGYRRRLTLDAEGSEADAALRNLGTPFAFRFARPMVLNLDGTKEDGRGLYKNRRASSPSASSPLASVLTRRPTMEGRSRSHRKTGEAERTTRRRRAR